MNPPALTGALVDSILMLKSSMILLRIFLEKMLCLAASQASGVRPAPLALPVDPKMQRHPVEFWNEREALTEAVRLSLAALGTQLKHLGP